MRQPPITARPRRAGHTGRSARQERSRSGTRVTRTAGVIAGCLTLVGATGLSGCAGFGNLGDRPGVTTLTVASVTNPQMQDMASLLPEFYAEHPDIKVNIIFMEENDLRNATTQDVATKAAQYDVMTVGAYEVPIWGKNGWLKNLTPVLSADSSYDLNDIFAPVREGVSSGGNVYAAPFYGESSFLMYRKDLFQQAGITMPEQPTWDQVQQYAEKLNDPSKGQAGICLRGKPGWGEMFAPLTTIVNTFGGQWYDSSWNAQVNAPGFTSAVQFYVDTLKKAGEPDPVSYGFTECQNLFQQGKAAMWYDATSAGGSLEDPKSSTVAGKVGFVKAPVKETKSAGWLWSWNLGINARIKDAQHEQAAETFVKWATSKDYAKLVGQKIGWANVPPGTRQSTYELPDYQKAASSFAPLTAEIMSQVDPKQPGVKPQPYTGIQFVSIPEFQDVGNQTSQEIANAIAGRETVTQALDNGQQIAQRAGEAQQKEAGK